MRQKFTLFTKTLLLLCALVAGSGSAWATEKSYTLSFKTSGSSNDGSTSWSASSKVSDVLSDGSDYVSSISAAANIYPARNGRGAKFGSSSKAGSITFALSNDGKVKATKVVIKGGAYISSSKAEAASVKVNSGTAVAFSQTVTSYTEEDITYNFPTATDITSLSLEQATASKGRLYIVSVTVYYEEDEAAGETATWTLAPASATVAAGGSTTLQLTTNYDGTLNFVSNDTETATVSYNSSSKVVTVNGINTGMTTIIITGTATATYKAISKSISVTVNHAELTSNFTDIMEPLGYSYFNLSPEGSNSYAQPDVTSTDKTDNYGVGISFARNGSSNSKPRFDDFYTRFYKGNTLTISAPAGSYITKVVFKEPSSNKGWDGTMTASTGDFINTEKTWYATSENITEVVFTNDATKRIGGIELYLMASSLQATVTSAGWATWKAPTAVSFAAGEAYIINSATSSATVLTEVSSVPAGTPVLLKGEGEHTMTVVASSATDVSSNCLHVSDGTAKDNVYVLADGNYGVGFYLWTGASALSAGKIYMQIPSGSREFIGLDNEVSGISATLNNGEETNTNVYDLQGRRVAEPTRGMYIVNGKKVIIR